MTVVPGWYVSALREQLEFLRPCGDCRSCREATDPSDDPAARSVVRSLAGRRWLPLTGSEASNRGILNAMFRQDEEFTEGVLGFRCAPVFARLMNHAGWSLVDYVVATDELDSKRGVLDRT